MFLFACPFTYLLNTAVLGRGCNGIRLHVLFVVAIDLTTIVRCISVRRQYRKQEHRKTSELLKDEEKGALYSQKTGYTLLLLSCIRKMDFIDLSVGQSSLLLGWTP